MSGHDYDGITELDNQLPRWWVLLFYATIAFSAVYLLVYHVLRVGDLQIAEYEADLQRAEAAQAALAIAQTTGSGQNTAGTPSIFQTGPSQPAAPAVVAADPTDPSTEASVLASGKTVYMTYCLPCHGDKGQGLVGPNFTDDWFIHGPDFADTLRVIREGVIAKGMVPWKGVLKPAEVLSVASFIHSLRGSNPPNAKAPEPEAKQHPPRA
jgi:cytochrome c oxidase cbb3-type subunit 3